MKCWLQQKCKKIRNGSKSKGRFTKMYGFQYPKILNFEIKHQILTCPAPRSDTVEME